MPRTQKKSIPSAFLRHTSIISTVSLLLLGVLWIGDDIYHFEQDSAAYRQEFLETRKREVRQEVELFLALIAERRTGLEDSLRRDIRDRVDEAWSVADNLHRLNAGKRSRTELADMIREALRPIRYNNGRGYFFATGLDGVEELFADRPEFEGRNLLDMKDPTGKPVIRDMIRIARERGAGYYEYLWTKPGSPDRDHRKLAYIRHFPGMDWLIGTGEYLEDVEDDLKSEILKELERARFGDGGYLFAGTRDGISLAGPAKGRNMLEVTDAGGLKVVRQLIAAASNGGGFVEYVMPPIDGIVPHRKLSYVTMVRDWGWYVGAGVNMDLVEQDIARKRHKLLANSLKHSGMLLGILGIIFLIQYLMARSATARLREGLAVFVDFFRRAGERGAVLVPESQPYCELEDLAATANSMIDGRLRAEKALQDSEARYRRLVDNALDAIFLSDRSGRILDANAQACRRLGYAYEELVTLNIWDVDAQVSPQIIEGFMDMIAEKGSAVVQGMHRRKDGSLFPVEIQATAFRENGTLLVLGVARDISERLEAEERLRQSEATFVQLFRFSPEAVFLLDLTSERILEVNEACLRLFGHSREDLLGRTSLEAGIYARRSDREAVLAELQRGRPVLDFELQMLHRDGRVLDCVLSSQLLNIRGEPHALTSIHDVTERKKMQEMLIESEKMISVGGIATGIAHEINNPLGIILQAAENLALRTRPDFPRNQEAAEAIGLDLALMDRYVKARKLDVFIQDIREAGIRAAFIVRNMLDFSRRGDSRRTMCNLRQIVEKALGLAASDYDLKKRCDFRNIRIDIAEEPHVPPVFCNETEMEQVFLNLFRNAAQAMAAAVPAEGPRIAVRISAPVRGLVRVEVEDNGPGIPTDVQRRIFEPFFTTRKPGAGTGLGLAVSYFIVTSGHGGHIRVSSVPGGGARFTVELPVQPGKAPENTAG
jgi:PAS domain S-box-containing protein